MSAELNTVLTVLRKEKAKTKPAIEQEEDLCTDNVEAGTIVMLSRETTEGTVGPPKVTTTTTTTTATNIQTEQLRVHAESHIGGVPLMTLWHYQCLQILVLWIHGRNVQWRVLLTHILLVQLTQG